MVVKQCFIVAILQNLRLRLRNPVQRILVPFRSHQNFLLACQILDRLHGLGLFQRNGIVLQYFAFRLTQAL